MKFDTALSLSQWKKLLIALCTSISALTMTACASSTTKSSDVQIPANLASKCPDLDLVPGLTGRVIVPWISLTVKEYQDCQDKVDGLQKAWPKSGK